MDWFNYEILHTARGAPAADRVRALIHGDAALTATSRPWTSPRAPVHADLYSLLVVASDDLADDPAIRARVQAIVRTRFPCALVVDSCSTYDFRRPPIPALAAMNAVGLDNPKFVVDTLLHHAGLRRHGTGGQVFLSYARRDGSALAERLRDELIRAGFRAFMDCHEIVGAVAIQREISREMRRSDLVLLIDSQGAAASPWVAEELDLARAAHVPVVAVTPARDAFAYQLPAPHVAWEAGDDVAAVASAAVQLARRVLARRGAFGERVARTLHRVCTLRGWSLVADDQHWLVRPDAGELRIACTEDTPTVEAVMQLCEVVGAGRGMLVGGTCPYPALTARGLTRVGGDHVCVTPLPRMASKLPTGLAPHALRGRRIFLSAAMPDLEDAPAAAETLAPFIVTFMQTMVDLGATVVFGGHPTVTPLVHRALVDVAAADAGVELHLAAIWMASGQLPPETDDSRVFRFVKVHGRGEDPAEDVAALRDAMIRPDLDAAVFVGGRTLGFIGDRPGIVDEYERFRAVCPTRRAFVLGLGEGAAADLLRRGEPPAAALDPRVAHELRTTADPDLATALIVTDLLGPRA